MFGAISAPVTATLRAGTSVAQGVSATATTFGNIGRDAIDTNSIYARFRPPRYINTRNVVTEFDEDLAAVAAIVSDLYKGKYANQSIQYYCFLPETRFNGDIVSMDPSASLLVITEHKLLYFKMDKEGAKKGQPTLLFKVTLRKVKSCEVYETAKGSYSTAPTYMLVITCYTVAKGIYKYAFVSVGDYPKLEKLYELLSILPQVEAEDKVKGTKSKAAIVLDKCF